MSLERGEKIIDDACFGAVPAAAEKVDANSAAKVIDRSVILLELCGILFLEVITGVIQQVDLLVWIGEIAKTDEVVLHNLERFPVRSDGDCDFGVLFKFRQVVRQGDVPFGSGQNAKNISKIAKATKEIEAFRKKECPGRHSVIPPSPAKKKQCDADHQECADGQHRDDDNPSKQRDCTG